MWISRDKERGEMRASMYMRAQSHRWTCKSTDLINANDCNS